jgi:predicted enzyme related to lactoylglutathione lyase
MAGSLAYAGAMSGRVVHFEIPFDDGDRARGFYREAFGWELMELPDMAYTLVNTGPSGEQGPSESGFINGGMLRRESPTEGPILVIDVEDIDAALARIEELGGQTLLGRQQVGDMGWAAYFKDIEGNSMGLWQTA